MTDFGNALAPTPVRVRCPLEDGPTWRDLYLDVCCTGEDGGFLRLDPFYASVETGAHFAVPELPGGFYYARCHNCERTASINPYVPPFECRSSPALVSDVLPEPGVGAVLAGVALLAALVRRRSS